MDWPSSRGLEAAYCFDHGLTPYVSSDLNIQTIYGQFGGVDDYLTLSAGLRIRRPLSRRLALYGQAALTYLRLSAPKYPQSFVGVGAEYFIGETSALSETLELPVYGDHELEDPPERILVGIRLYLAGFPVYVGENWRPIHRAPISSSWVTFGEPPCGFEIMADARFT